MKVGDLVVFRSDKVPGLIVAQRSVEEQTKVPRMGILWIDCDYITWEPAEYLKVISESR